MVINLTSANSEHYETPEIDNFKKISDEEIAIGSKPVLFNTKFNSIY